MMKRFVKGTAALVLITALFCATIVDSARSEPLPPPVNGLNWCASLPCYRGIVLNKTSWNEAIDRFANIANVIGESRITVNGPLATVTLYRVASDVAFGSTVDYVLLEFTGDFTLGSLVAFFGPPCQIMLDQTHSSLWISYPFLTAGVNIPAAEFSFGTAFDTGWKIRSISFGDMSGLCKLRAQRGDSVQSAWRGFSTLNSYYTRQ